MILLAHTFTGAVIGVKLGNPYLVAILAFISHIILDSIPHANLPIPRKPEPIQILKTLPDVLPSIGLYFVFLYIFPQHWVNITIGVAFAILLDFLSLFELIPKFDKWLSKLYRFHERIQNKERLIEGSLFQIIYILLILYIFIKT